MLTNEGDTQVCSEQLPDSDANAARRAGPAAILFADRYEILSCIGSGGMGAIYLAKQTLINRLVALKILLPKREADTISILRFRQEAEAASQLSHPNIVSVFDFGVDGDIPYLAMEYIDGAPLSQIIKKSGPLQSERALAIFLQTCDALEEAHAHDVIHRDLKPSNIIIANNGNRLDHVKIVDFGIAKLGRSDSEDHIQLTRTGEVVGSPPYMSPEQCLGQELDQRSDIYSMGCVMYEALTGRVPFRGQSFVEICSKHLTEAPESLTKICSGKKHIDLFEPIIFKALAKEPEQRFRSMAELKASLEEVSGAMTGGWLPQVNAWWKSRHATTARLLKGNALLPVVAIPLCVVGTTVLVPAWLDGNSQPVNSPSNPSIISDPVASWNHFDIDGQQAFNSGNYVDARRNFEAAVSVADTFSKTDRLALSLEKLAVLFHVLENREEESKVDVRLAALRHEDPEPMNHDESLHQSAVLEGMLNMLSSDPNHIDRKKFNDLAQQLNLLSRHYINEGKAERAIQLQTKLIPRIRQILGSRHVRLCRALQIFGDALVETKQYSRGEVALRQSVSIAASLSDSASDLTRGLTTLAEALRHKGAFVEAAHLHERVIAIQLKASSCKSEDIAWSYWRLGKTLNAQNKYTAAEKAYSQALTLFEKTQDHEMISNCVDMIAWLSQRLGNPERSQKLYMQALAKAERKLGREHRDVAEYLEDLAIFYWQRGQLSKAEPLLQRALAIRQHTMAPHEPEVSEILHNLSGIYHNTRRYRQAELLCRQELAINDRIKSPDRHKLLASIDGLAVACYGQGNKQEAQRLAKRALATLLSIPANQYQELDASFYALGHLYFSPGEYQKVEAWLNRCIAFSRDHRGRDHGDTAQSLDDLAHLYYVEGKYHEMKQPSQEAVAIVERNPHINPSQAAQIVENYGVFCQRDGRYLKRASELRRGPL